MNCQGPLSASGHVFHIVWHCHPRMLALFIDREGRGWKRWVSKRSNRYCDSFLSANQHKVDRVSTRGAEGEPALGALIADPNEFAARSIDFHCLAREPGLCCEHTSRPTLTGEAVAHGDAHGFTG